MGFLSMPITKFEKNQRSKLLALNFVSYSYLINPQNVNNFMEQEMKLNFTYFLSYIPQL